MGFGIYGSAFNRGTFRRLHDVLRLTDVGKVSVSINSADPSSNTTVLRKRILQDKSGEAVLCRGMGLIQPVVQNMESRFAVIIVRINDGEWARNQFLGCENSLTCPPGLGAAFRHGKPGGNCFKSLKCVGDFHPVRYTHGFDPAADYLTEVRFDVPPDDKDYFVKPGFDCIMN